MIWKFKSPSQFEREKMAKEIKDKSNSQDKIKILDSEIKDNNKIIRGDVK